MSARSTVRGSIARHHVENRMRVELIIDSSSCKHFDACMAVMKGRALVLALANLLQPPKRMAAHDLVPSFAGACVTLSGELDSSTSLFGMREELSKQLTVAAELLKSSEHLLSTRLTDRSLSRDARLPIQVVHAPTIVDLLEYDREHDVIRCRVPDWSFIVEKNIKLLEELAGIATLGLLLRLKIDGTPLVLPHVGPSVFKHKKGPGHLKDSVAMVTGLHQLSGEVELRIEGFRDGRVVKGRLSDAARRAAIAHRLPFTAAVTFSEPTPLLPLLPMEPVMPFIERMWDFQEQGELALA